VDVIRHLWLVRIQVAVDQPLVVLALLQTSCRRCTLQRVEVNGAAQLVGQTVVQLCTQSE
jgi:hypothetical protein